MKERYIPAFIMLVAGTITSIINIINKVDTETGLLRLLLVMILFYIIGLIVKAVLKRILASNLQKNEAEENTEKDQHTEEKNS